MAKFDFTKEEYNDILTKIFLNEEEKEILRMKLLNYSEIKIADILNISVKTEQRRWKRIKEQIKRVL